MIMSLYFNAIDFASNFTNPELVFAQFTKNKANKNCYFRQASHDFFWLAILPAEQRRVMIFSFYSIACCNLIF